MIQRKSHVSPSRCLLVPFAFLRAVMLYDSKVQATSLGMCTWAKCNAERRMIQCRVFVIQSHLWVFVCHPYQTWRQVERYHSKGLPEGSLLARIEDDLEAVRVLLTPQMPGCCSSDSAWPSLTLPSETVPPLITAKKLLNTSEN